MSIHTPNIDIGVAEKLREFKGKYLYLRVQTLDEKTAKILLSSDSKYKISLPDDIILEGQNISNILRGSKRVTY